MTGPTAPDLSIGRLSLNAGPMSEADARRLAELVGLALARIPNLPSSADTGKVSVEVPAQTGRSIVELADAVARAIAAALRIEAVR
jgi:hypothetical protein